MSYAAADLAGELVDLLALDSDNDYKIWSHDTAEGEPTGQYIIDVDEENAFLVTVTTYNPLNEDNELGGEG